jgi:hypothetical protein
MTHCEKNPAFSIIRRLIHPISRIAMFAFFVNLFISWSTAMNADAIAESSYVTIDKDGHLQRDGKRVRYWAFHGHAIDRIDDNVQGATRIEMIKKRRADLDIAAKRIKDLGFNLYRNYYPTFDTDYEIGDGSMQDLTAYFFDQLDKNGIKIWHAGLMAGAGTVGPEDVDIINDPSTAAEWKAAVSEWVKKNGGKRVELTYCAARSWDPQLEALGFAGIKKRVMFRNKYKDGLAMADDPQVVVWEQSNEEMWFINMLAGKRWAETPEYFQRELLKKWASFLTKKYGTEEKLRAVWGFLLPGESLADATIKLMPLGSPTPGDIAVNDANPDVISALRSTKKEFSVEDFDRQCGADLLEFLIGIAIAHHQREAEALKAAGKSCRLCPMIWDTGNWFQIQLAYMQQIAGVVSTATYIKGMEHVIHSIADSKRRRGSAMMSRGSKTQKSRASRCSFTRRKLTAAQNAGPSFRCA